MSITTEDIKRIAGLSKLAIEDHEIDSYVSHLGQVTDMMQSLSQVDTTDVKFTSNVTTEINVLREDVPVRDISREALLKNVPDTEDGFIKVPAIMDNGEA